MTALTPDGWLQSGALLYRLTEDRRPSNRDEIRVTMADQSHSPESCTRRAGELLDRIRRIEALEAELAKLRDSECDKIMAMSEDQIAALTRMQGSNPDDVAKIGRMACDLALKDVAIQRLEAELAAAKRDAERYRLLRGRWLMLSVVDRTGDLAFAMQCEDVKIDSEHDGKRLDAAIDAAREAQEKA